MTITNGYDIRSLRELLGALDEPRPTSRRPGWTAGGETDPLVPAPVWEEAPRRLAAGELWEARLAPLRERPGAWARVYEAPSTAAAYGAISNIKAGQTVCPDGFEMRSGKHPEIDGAGAIWARYVGENGEYADD